MPPLLSHTTGGVNANTHTEQQPEPEPSSNLNHIPTGQRCQKVSTERTVVTRARSCRYVNPALLAVAEALDRARAEIQAGDRAGGRTTLAYAEQLRAAHVRHAEPTGELPSVGAEAEPEAEPAAEPAAATGHGGLGGCGLCDVPTGMLGSSPKAKKKKEVRQQAQVACRGTSDQHQVSVLTREAEEPRRSVQPAQHSLLVKRRLDYGLLVKRSSIVCSCQS